MLRAPPLLVLLLLPAAAGGCEAGSVAVTLDTDDAAIVGLWYRSTALTAERYTLHSAHPVATPTQ